jgi:hypothetical protein
MDGKAMVLHDFQAADDQELTVFKDQEVNGGRTPAWLVHIYSSAMAPAHLNVW